MTHSSPAASGDHNGFQPMRQDDWVGSPRGVVDPGLPVDVPRARANDPATSKRAARVVLDSGTLKGQQAEVLALVRKYPGHTAVELAQRARGDDWRAFRYAVSRRLPELAEWKFVKRGRPRVCEVSGSPQTTWYPREGGV